MKSCRDCIHFWGRASCARVHGTEKEPVSGQDIANWPVRANAERKGDRTLFTRRAKCGPSARFFEPATFPTDPKLRPATAPVTATALAMTSDEAALIDAAAALWNAFLRLPVEHPSDRAEFCDAVHRIQALILMRPGRRSYNEPAFE